MHETISWRVSEIGVVSVKAGFGNIKVIYVERKLEAMKTKEDISLKERAKENYLQKDKNKY